MNSSRLEIKVLASTSWQKKEIEKELGSDRDESGQDDGQGDINEQKEVIDGEVHVESDETRESDEESSSTYSSIQDSDAESEIATGNPPAIRPQHVSCIYEVQLSPDGTCIFTTDHSRTFSVYLIDQDILETQATRIVKPYAKFTSPDPIRAFAASPNFALHDGRTTQVLISARDHHINLHNAIHDVSAKNTSEPTDTISGPINISTRIANYKLIDHLTEAVITPLCLDYTRDSTHFLAGSSNQVSIFDINHSYDPVYKIRTIPSKKLSSGSLGYKGDVSALSISSSTGTLAVGTRTRHVGLYSTEGFGELITHFELPRRLDGGDFRDGMYSDRLGHGVTQLKWSPCGKYLYIAERRSDTILTYDVRNFSVALRYCVGRKAMTNQKLGFDIWSHGGESRSHEIWAGGMDGSVRMWRDPHLGEGPMEPDEVVHVGDSPIAGTSVHPCGRLAVTGSGNVEVGGEYGVNRGDNANERGGGRVPRYKEWGRLDILGLSS